MKVLPKNFDDSLASSSFDSHEFLPVVVSESPSGDGDQNEGQGGDQGGAQSDTETLSQVDTPKMFKVLLLNDDFTPMDFVVLVLRRFFAKSEEAATKVMLDVHRQGSGLAGIYTLEIAEMKVMQTNQFAQLHQHPLKSVMEEDSP